jgi:hypothetical protein
VSGISTGARSFTAANRASTPDATSAASSVMNSMLLPADAFIFAAPSLLRNTLTVSRCIQANASGSPAPGDACSGTVVTTVKPSTSR